MSDTVTSQVGPWAMVPVWVLGIGLTGSELAVYVALRSFADRAGESHPHVKTIASRAGVSERTAERAIAKLRTLGAVKVTQWHRPDGAIGGCNYELYDLPVGANPGVTVTPPPDEDVATPPTRMSPPPDEDVGTRTHQKNTPEDLLLLPPPADPPAAPGPQEEEAPPEEPPGTNHPPPVEALTAAVRDTAGRLASEVPADTLIRACARLPGQGWTPGLLAAAVRGHDWGGAGPGALVTWLRHLDAPVTRASGTGRRPAFTACPEHPEHPAGRCPECAKECVPAGGRLRKARRTSTRVPGILVQ